MKTQTNKKGAANWMWTTGCIQFDDLLLEYVNPGWGIRKVLVTSEIHKSILPSLGNLTLIIGKSSSVLLFFS